MNNKFIVTKSFGVCFDPEDVFEKTENGYEIDVKSEGDNFSGKFIIDENGVKHYEKAGFLTEKKEQDNSKKHVNVFDEIDDLKTKYEQDLMFTHPLNYEKRTVLCNIVKVLDHLKNLKHEGRK